MKKCAFLVCIAIYFGILHVRLVGQLPEPKPESFRSDEMFYLKTFYLVKRGGNFYTSLMSADAARGGKMKPDVFTWRWPTIFYLWAAFAKNGTQILYLFWILALFSWISIYFILKKYIHPMLAFMGAVLIVPYFLDAVYYKTSFLFTEWWSWFFLIFALTFFTYQKKYPAWILFLLTILIRELMIIPIIIYLLISIIFKKNRLFFISLVCSFLILLFIHKSFVMQTVQIQSTANNIQQTLSRIHVPVKTDLFKMLSFSMRQYPFIQYKFHLVLFLLSLFSFVKILFIKAPLGLIYVIFSGWGLALLLPFISGAYNDYWGITFMPSILMIIPLFLYKKIHEKNT